MIKIFDKNKFKNSDAVYSDSDCFNVNNEELEIFDKKFPHKEILKQDTWL